MDTHHHLVLQAPGDRISDRMRLLNGGHSRAFNTRHGRRGALFEARYRDREIRDDRHLEEAIRYVERNAVSAGAVDDVAEWPWSTHATSPLRALLEPSLTSARFADALRTRNVPLPQRIDRVLDPGSIRRRDTMTKLLTLIGIAALCVVASASAAKGNGRPYIFRGELSSVSSTQLAMKVEGGDHAALRLLLGQSQDQTFTVGYGTEFLIWTKGIPKVVGPGDLHAGDWIQVTVRAKGGASLSEVEANPIGVVGDHVTEPNPPSLPLYLYVGTVDGPQAGGHIALHVKAGNVRALRTLVGQSADQTFSYGDDTIFLLWQGKVPTVIDPSQLKAGDRITIRIRAPFRSSLSQVESTPARHVGDHEPGVQAAATTS